MLLNLHTVAVKFLIKMKTVLSGIRPTGNLHLGNYFRSIKQFCQNVCGTIFFFIADYHSLTTSNPQNIQGNVKSVLAQYLAAGLDPEKSNLIHSKRCS